MSEIKIRPLKVSDGKKIVGMIKRLVQKIGPSGISDIITADVTEKDSSIADDDKAITPRMAEIIVGIFVKLIDNLEGETDAFFADLIGCSVEEFGDMPFGAELQIINQMLETKEANDFFTNALHLRKLTIELKGRFRKEKTA